MNFKKIKNQDDIKELMDEFGYFHDSCIKEMVYVSGGYVDVKVKESNRAMYPFNSKRSLSIIFQSQNAKYPVIEMKFDLIQKLNLYPKNEEYDCVIYDASLVQIGEMYYWSEWGDFKLEDISEAEATWVSSKEVSWRKLPEKFLGEGIIYTKKK